MRDPETMLRGDDFTVGALPHLGILHRCNGTMCDKLHIGQKMGLDCLLSGPAYFFR
jgi:hypothetical protein